MSYTPRRFNLSPKLKLGVGRGFSPNKLLKISSTLFLLLALGLTANSARLIWQHQAQAKNQSSPEPRVLGASDTAAKQAEKSNYFEFEEYKIKNGDTLFNVSQRYNISWTTLATLNELKSPFTLKRGQTLKIPKQ